MSTHLECNGVRMRLMAMIDGEADQATVADREHASTCQACRQWLASFESLGGELRDLAYQDTGVDLWSAVQGRISTPDRVTPMVRELWWIAGVVVAWRALQLFVDLPMPALHPIVPIPAMAILAWRMGADLLAIETFAPELRKRGI